MALTDMSAKAAKLSEGKAQDKFTDGKGMYLLVNKSGKYWRMDYRFAGKRATLAIGTYPAVTLKKARKARDDAKELLSNNIDPNQAKQADKRRAIKDSQAKKFKGVALEMIAIKSSKWSDSYCKDTIRRLEQHVFPWVGSLPMTYIKTPDVLELLRRIESTGSIETAHKVRMICGQVFRFAIAIGLVEYDVTQALKGALIPKDPTHRACLTDPKTVGGLMRAIAGFQGTLVVQCALRLSPLVFARPTEIRHAEWKEIDLEAETWVIPPHKMKMKETHVIPLCTQAIEIFKEIEPLTGAGKYVFPNIRKPDRAMSANTINNALQRMGYNTATEQCAHGFRGTASTLLRSLQWSHDVIEIQLAHKTGSDVSRSYNHYKHLPERGKMMQAWGDYLDGLRSGADVIPIKRQA